MSIMSIDIVLKVMFRPIGTANVGNETLACRPFGSLWVGSHISFVPDPHGLATTFGSPQLK
jgi:hypothetical protein